MDTAPLRFDLPRPDLGDWRAGNTGTEGVWHFDSGRPGRRVMVTALVHGNELCGAWALLGLARRMAPQGPALARARAVMLYGIGSVAAYWSWLRVAALLG